MSPTVPCLNLRKPGLERFQKSVNRMFKKVGELGDVVVVMSMNECFHQGNKNHETCETFTAAYSSKSVYT